MLAFCRICGILFASICLILPHHYSRIISMINCRKLRSKAVLFSLTIKRGKFFKLTRTIDMCSTVWQPGIL